MYNHQDSQLCYRDSVHKDWKIYVVDDNDPSVITNEVLYKDELTITKTLCSKEDITLGSCEADTLEFKITNTGLTLKGKTLRVDLILNHHTNNPVPIGIYKVDSDELENDQRERSIKAYDSMRDILNKDFATWFNNLQFPMTMKEFRDAFFTFCEIEQETTTLMNDNLILDFEVTNSQTTARMLKEEEEKITQEKEASEYGIPVMTYERILPSTYSQYESSREITHPIVFQSTYTRVENPAAGSNPKELHWFEKNSDDVYFLTNDTEVNNLRTYYTLDAADNTINPHDLGWMALNKNHEFAIYFFRVSSLNVLHLAD